MTPDPPYDHSSFSTNATTYSFLTILELFLTKPDPLFPTPPTASASSDSLPRHHLLLLSQIHYSHSHSTLQSPLHSTLTPLQFLCLSYRLPCRSSQSSNRLCLSIRSSFDPNLASPHPTSLATTRLLAPALTCPYFPFPSFEDSPRFPRRRPTLSSRNRANLCFTQRWAIAMIRIDPYRPAACCLWSLASSLAPSSEPLSPSRLVWIARSRGAIATNLWLPCSLTHDDAAWPPATLSGFAHCHSHRL